MAAINNILKTLNLLMVYIPLGWLGVTGVAGVAWKYKVLIFNETVPRVTFPADFNTSVRLCGSIAVAHFVVSVACVLA